MRRTRPLIYPVWPENSIYLEQREKIPGVVDNEAPDVKVSGPFRFLLISLSGWMKQRQLSAIDYLREENRVLREHLGVKRLRLNDDQRRRLAAKAKGLGRTILAEVATIVTPETLLSWHQKLPSSAVSAWAAC